MRIPALALAAAFVSGVLMALLPTYTVVTGGAPGETVRHVSLLQHQGPGVLLVLAAPALLTAGALVLQRTRYARVANAVVAVLLWAAVALGAASVGLLFVPVAVLMTWAALAPRRHARRR